MQIQPLKFNSIVYRRFAAFWTTVILNTILFLYLLFVHLFFSLSCRDQNFGLNELAAIQDVRNEYNLQDITDEPPSGAAASAATNDRGE